MDPKDIVAVVTGGASGLGEAAVRSIVEQGGKAIIADVNAEKGEALSEELNESAVFYPLDVTNEEQIKEGLTKAAHHFGYINALVNCAGIVIAEKVSGKEGSHRLDSFQKVIEVNLTGTFNMIRLTAEKMIGNQSNEEGERGIIINTASIAAFDGQIGQAAYSASKGGVASMTLPISRELARFGIRVMTIAPGLFETPMFDVLPAAAKEALGKSTPFPNRLGQPREYGKLALSIIENPMLNGEVIRLDGAIRLQPK
ncbi:3-hydroxyacyl-CoA dehydrogenase [Halobacillus andaensis]|uniref:3-hydroxyacyl-CoA dehydrogenase n=1 Tax=Halobacillus andaensis TaxID=1176239 RepID=A0A917B4G4_HALAA|nr:3-hydroxyacyl-CoA dehydrogenase [Halobacillus andaensis]MBP2004682.1 NAD(P)-dependent dehydrogenase (short-subunit alcohol dehydrogenase family) [Halobacillus andaensis]GGF19775.1 3-hydroxyacyl-CoA dehydrogenase [Halobacillus andaensis]